MTKSKPIKTDPSGLAERREMIQVERVIYDFRRGLPVVIVNTNNSAAIVVASELVDRQSLLDLEDLQDHSETGHTPPQIHITHRRAETLKIRLYTEGVISLPIVAREPLAFITHLCDPQTDLRFPLSGPFRASRDAPGPATIASVKLAKLAGLLPSTVSIPLDLTQEKSLTPSAWSEAKGLLVVKAASIQSYEAQAARTLQPLAHKVLRITDAEVPLADALSTRLVAFRPQGTAGGGPEHLAIVIGSVDPTKPVLVRLHSECFTGDLLGSLKCDCGEQLRGAIAAISQAGSGILLYLAQEGRGIGLMNKLRAYQLQDQGFDTVEANLRLGFEVDERLFEVAAEMLKQLGVHDVRLMTNNPEKVEQLTEFEIKVSERVAHAFATNEHNAHYLDTKAKKTGHIL
jgi:GTP cyclohydrolase II